jgi:hypothetical protein
MMQIQILGRVPSSVYRECSRDGYASYVGGLPLSGCPRFRDDDMARYWRIGWHHAHEAEVQHGLLMAHARCEEDCAHICKWPGEKEKC